MTWIWSTEDLEEFVYAKIKVSHCKKCGTKRIRTFSYQFGTRVSREMIDDNATILVHDTYFGILDKKKEFKRVFLPRYAAGYREKIDVSNEPNVPCVVYPRMCDVSRNDFIANEALVKSPERYVLSGDVIVGQEDILRDQEIEIYQTVCFKCLQSLYDEKEKVIRQGNLMIRVVKEEEEKEEERIYRAKVSNNYLHKFQSIYASEFIDIYNHRIDISMEKGHANAYILYLEGVGAFGVIDVFGVVEKILLQSPDHEDLEIEVRKNDTVLLYHPQPTSDLD